MVRTGTAREALRLIDEQAALLVVASTRESQAPRTSTERAFKNRRQEIRLHLDELGLQDPIPFEQLGSWDGYWSLHLPTWADRRTHVAGLVSSTRETLIAIAASEEPADTGRHPDLVWNEIEDRVEGIRERLRQAGGNFDNYQDVGRRCREVLIDVATALADPDVVASTTNAGENPPKAGDANAWIGAYLDVHAAGSGHAQLRKFIRATWDLAQRVTHARIDRIETFAAAQATIAIVRTLQQIDISSRENL